VNHCLSCSVHQKKLFSQIKQKKTVIRLYTECNSDYQKNDKPKIQLKNLLNLKPALLKEELSYCGRQRNGLDYSIFRIPLAVFPSAEKSFQHYRQLAVLLDNGRKQNEAITQIILPSCFHYHKDNQQKTAKQNSIIRTPASNAQNFRIIHACVNQR